MNAYRFLRLWLRHGWLAGALIGAGLNVHAEIPQNARAADDAKYLCPKVAQPGDLLATAQRLSEDSFDKNKLACAADLSAEAVKSNGSAAPTLLAAIAAQNTYFQEIQLQRELDFIGAQAGEWNARQQHATESMQQLCAIASRELPQDAAARALCARAELLMHRNDEPKDYVAATRRAIPVLNEVTRQSPEVLGGAPLVWLGKLYLDLPVIFGGNAAASVQLLETARRIDPRDPERLADLALAYDEVGRDADAKAALRELLALDTAAPARLQSLADAFMVGSGLGARMPDAELQAGFEAKRHALFAAHPQLNTRIRTAIAGHGGENPLTGKRQY